MTIKDQVHIFSIILSNKSIIKSIYMAMKKQQETINIKKTAFYSTLSFYKHSKPFFVLFLIFFERFLDFFSIYKLSLQRKEPNNCG